MTDTTQEPTVAVTHDEIVAYRTTILGLVATVELCLRGMNPTSAQELIKLYRILAIAKEGMALGMHTVNKSIAEHPEVMDAKTSTAMESAIDRITAQVKS